MAVKEFVTVSLIMCKFYFTSFSQQNFGSIVIGNQEWMDKNLSVSTFRNGDTIPEIKDSISWIEASEQGIPGWCYYNNDSTIEIKYH